MTDILQHIESAKKHASIENLFIQLRIIKTSIFDSKRRAQFFQPFLFSHSEQFLFELVFLTLCFI